LFSSLTLEAENSFIMKTVGLLLPGILLSIIFPLHLFSQCANGAPASTITYDSTVTGNGSSSTSFSFPKFDPAIGTLLSADIKSVVNTTYSYTLENITASNQTYKVRVLRSDDVSSTALDPSSISLTHQTGIVNTSLSSGQSFSYGPKPMNYTITNSVTDARLINFMGAGTVDFDYEGSTSTSVTATGQFGFNFSAADTTVFSVTYQYCATSLLSSNLLFFTATPSKGRVLLNWRQMNIENGRSYNVQVSTDGRIFKNIASLGENNIGAYAYTYLNNESGRLYFRIEQKNVSGEIKYSNIRITDPEQAANKVHIYPTLYTGGNLQVDFPYKADWQINIYSAEGKRMAQNRETDAYNTQISLPAMLSNGTYTAEVVDIHTQQKQFTRIVVRR